MSQCKQLQYVTYSAFFVFLMIGTYKFKVCNNAMKDVTSGIYH